MTGDDETGNVFGSLTAIARVQRWNWSGAIYSFRCICGDESERCITDVRAQLKAHQSGKRPAPVACKRCVAAFVRARRATRSQLGALTH